MKDDYYAMAFYDVKNMGKGYYVEMLLRRFGSFKNAYYADKRELESIFNYDVANKIYASARKFDFEGAIKKLEKRGLKYISLDNPLYPNLLREIKKPPIGLYYRGRIPDNELETVAIVGSRKSSGYGETAAYTMSKKLAEVNVCIISGMAEGIDTFAHKGCLDGYGFTVAVLGSGHDYCYPSSNRGLMERIAEKGCVLSEYPPEIRPSRFTFPVRNRIIAGMSESVLVVEAGAKSGSLITADIALDEGREVFAVPGMITSNLSAGTNTLIKQGATLVSDYTDILNTLGIAYNAEENFFPTKSQEKLETNEKKVYDCISLAPLSIDEISQTTHIPASKLLSAITMLELKGYVKKLPKGYVKAK